MRLVERLRAWARSYTARGHYSPVGIAFHWIMAALVLFQLGWGWRVSGMDAGFEKLQGYQTHSDIGLLILLLAILRAGWRILVPDPINDADRQGWKSTVAHVTHYVFYVCLVGLPLSGWAMWSALDEAQPMAIAGLVPWPRLPLGDLSDPVQWAVLDWAEDIHLVLVLTLAALVPVHVAAALKHHFWDRDDVLEAMLPDPSEDEAEPAAGGART